MSITVPFRKPYIPAALASAYEQAAQRGAFEPVEALEADVAAATGIRYALSTSSSTAALHLALCALDLKRGDKVLCSVSSFVDVPEVVRHFDAEPVFVDTLPGSRAVDPQKLAEAADKIQGKKLRAVIVDHPAGQIAPMEAIRSIADTYGLIVIEDATEAVGSPAIGRYSDMAVIGFGSKIDNAVDGGMLLTDDADYHARGTLLRNHAMTYASEETRYLYDVLSIGCQYRMSEHTALYCRMAFAQTEQTVARRREIAREYFRALSGLPNITLPEDDDAHLYTQFVLTVGTNRDAFARKLREKGIEVSVQYVPLNFTRYYKEKYGLKVFDFPVALESYQKIMSLPIYPQMRDQEVAYVCDAIVAIAQNHR